MPTRKTPFSICCHTSARVLIHDRTLARNGKLIYLPNKGKFYQHHIGKGPGLDLTADHPIIARRDTIRADLAEAAAEASAARARRAAERSNKAVGGDESPVDIFSNARHAVADLLARYGYEQAGQSDV